MNEIQKLVLAAVNKWIEESSRTLCVGNNNITTLDMIGKNPNHMSIPLSENIDSNNSSNNSNSNTNYAHVDADNNTTNNITNPCSTPLSLLEPDKSLPVLLRKCNNNSKSNNNDFDMNRYGTINQNQNIEEFYKELSTQIDNSNYHGCSELNDISLESRSKLIIYDLSQCNNVAETVSSPSFILQMKRFNKKRKVF